MDLRFSVVHFVGKVLMLDETGTDENKNIKVFSFGSGYFVFNWSDLSLFSNLEGIVVFAKNVVPIFVRILFFVGLCIFVVEIKDLYVVEEKVGISESSSAN